MPEWIGQTIGMYKLLDEVINHPSTGDTWCSRCSRLLFVVEDFHRSTSRPSGHSPWCADCKNFYNKKYLKTLTPVKAEAKRVAHREYIRQIRCAGGRKLKSLRRKLRRNRRIYIVGDQIKAGKVDKLLSVELSKEDKKAWILGKPLSVRFTFMEPRRP